MKVSNNQKDCMMSQKGRTKTFYATFVLGSNWKDGVLFSRLLHVIFRLLKDVEELVITAIKYPVT